MANADDGLLMCDDCGQSMGTYLRVSHHVACGDCLEDRTPLKREIEQLKEELREANSKLAAANEALAAQGKGEVAAVMEEAATLRACLEEAYALAHNRGQRWRLRVAGGVVRLERQAAVPGAGDGVTREEAEGLRPGSVVAWCYTKEVWLMLTPFHDELASFLLLTGARGTVERFSVDMWCGSYVMDHPYWSLLAC